MSTHTPYTPEKNILSRYASVLVDFALGGGTGIKKNEIVYLDFDSPALPLAIEVYRSILEAGGLPMVNMRADEFQKILFSSASDDQLRFFPEKFFHTLADTIDHRIYLISKKDPMHLKDVPPQKIMKANESVRKFRKWIFEKEDAGKFTWTLAVYGTEGMAHEAGLSAQEYWEQIIRACFLDTADPINVWKSVYEKLHKIETSLNSLPIRNLYIKSQDTDLKIFYGEKRRFVGGSGRNIPSFELFTSPDWRGTEGFIYFDQPLYRYGSIVKDIRLRFENGKVIEAKAGKNENLLKELVAQKNADKIGEFSLTDVRFSKIDKFMADTLFDENFGGKWGNTHLALGTSYHDCYAGEAKNVSETEWERMGFNESPEHCDIIATNDRTVEAEMHDGSRKMIYAKGNFIF